MLNSLSTKLYRNECVLTHDIFLLLLLYPYSLFLLKIEMSFKEGL